VHRQAEESSIYQFKLFEDSSLVFVADQIGLSGHAVNGRSLNRCLPMWPWKRARRGEPVADAALRANTRRRDPQHRSAPAGAYPPVLADQQRDVPAGVRGGDVPGRPRSATRNGANAATAYRAIADTVIPPVATAAGIRHRSPAMTTPRTP
jgi:hypothetical protein